ncbi:MAG: hypothetical protein ABIH08_02375 [Candidatus Omnitrophota bacterium]
MSPRTREKISAELNKRKNSGVEENLAKLDIEIERLQQEADKGSLGETGEKKLMKLIEARSKYKYLYDTFLKLTDE